MGKVSIGTSGFSYPHWGKGIFYPQGLSQSKWFEHYCQHFKTVELNVSFYRLPKKETFEGWRKRAGKDFIFAIKGNRYITHIKRLKDCQGPIGRFFKNASGIKKEKNDKDCPCHREVVLWQLPPRFKVNTERLDEFLKILPRDWRYAFEFRDESWLMDGVYKLLKEHNAAVVFQDNHGWPISKKITADFVYLRFHGKTRLYSSCYTEKELKDWAKKIRTWQKEGIDCYAFFNNDALGYAVDNAQTLKKLCSKKR